jgi:hypothetical protein
MKSEFSSFMAWSLKKKDRIKFRKYIEDRKLSGLED